MPRTSVFALLQTLAEQQQEGGDVDDAGPMARVAAALAALPPLPPRAQHAAVEEPRSEPPSPLEVRSHGLRGPSEGALAAAGALQELAASFAGDDLAPGPTTDGPSEPVAAEESPAPAAGLPPGLPPGWLRAGHRDPHADTASLLRELSSLGLADEPAPATPRPARPGLPPPAVTAASRDKDRRRKGLFGRA